MVSNILAVMEEIRQNVLWSVMLTTLSCQVHYQQDILVKCAQATKPWFRLGPWSIKPIFHQLPSVFLNLLFFTELLIALFHISMDIKRKNFLWQLVHIKWLTQMKKQTQQLSCFQYLQHLKLSFVMHERISLWHVHDFINLSIYKPI